MSTTGRLVLVLLAFLSGCAAEPLYQGEYQQLGEVPAPFLETYPNGSQSRELEAVQGTFERAQDQFRALYATRVRQGLSTHGQVNFAVALQPSGSVEAASVISSELNDPDFEKALLQQIALLQFGPASGNGLFVFWYPLKFVR